MQRGLNIILIVLLLSIVASITATYYKYFILQDYEVEFEIDCDPYSESCFTWVCDPEIDGEDYCTGDPDEDIWDYKLFYRNAMHVPQCEMEDEICVGYDLECSPEEDCYEITCTEELAEEMGLDNCTHYSD